MSASLRFAERLRSMDARRGAERHGPEEYYAHVAPTWTIARGSAKIRGKPGGPYFPGRAHAAVRAIAFPLMEKQSVRAGRDGVRSAGRAKIQRIKTGKPGKLIRASGVHTLKRQMWETADNFCDFLQSLAYFRNNWRNYYAFARYMCVLTLGAVAVSARCRTVPVTVQTTGMIGVADGQTARLNC